MLAVGRNHMSATKRRGVNLETMSADLLYNNAVKLKKANDFELAADAFRKALQADKDHVPSQIGLGSLLMEHPDLIVGSDDPVVLLTQVARRICCPPEIKKATITIMAVNRMMKAAKQTADAKSKMGKENSADAKDSASTDALAQVSPG